MNVESHYDVKVAVLFVAHADGVSAVNEQAIKPALFLLYLTFSRNHDIIKYKEKEWL